MPPIAVTLGLNWLVLSDESVEKTESGPEMRPYVSVRQSLIERREEGSRLSLTHALLSFLSHSGKEDIECPILSPPLNGSVEVKNRSVGDVATYSCMSGFVLDGSPTRTCQTNGAWGGTPPTCEGKYHTVVKSLVRPSFVGQTLTRGERS